MAQKRSRRPVSRATKRLTSIRWALVPFRNQMAGRRADLCTWRMQLCLEAAEQLLEALAEHSSWGVTMSSLRGSKNGTAKLNEAQAVQIRKLYRTGRSQVSLAREYGVSNVAIRLLVLRRTWRHV
jgi:hypothetical protein